MISTIRSLLPAASRRGLPLALALLVLSTGRAEDRSYAVRLLDEKLVKDAHAVIREYSVTFRVRDRQQARLSVQRAVTVFDAQGRGNGELSLMYDRFRSIRKLEGRILDQNGAEVRDLEKSDLHDFSAVSGYSLYEDSRERTAELFSDPYPYTVEYTYEIDYSGLLDWPDWCAQEDEDAVEHSRFSIILPEADTLRYWTNADSVRPAVQVEDGLRRYTWEAAALPQQSEEMMEEDIDVRTLIVCTAPASFQIDEYPGEMTSWKSLGAWMAGLYKGKEILPEAARRDVHALVQPGDSPRDKAVKLYKYMQGRTRYVSVQLGIGGWQPYDASYVHERGYGDCKALSNYMIALLREGGVQAFPVLIHSGTRPSLYVRDFPSQQFNHVIVCVPLERDSLWLECTSQRAPAGHLGASTENRFALLLRPDGGELVSTPRSSAGENAQVRSSRVSLLGSGEVQGEMKVRCSGDQSDNVRYALADASPEDQQRWLLDHLRVPNVQLRSFAVDGLNAADARLMVSTDIAVPRYGSRSGNRMFFEPNLAERRTTIPRDMPSRRSPVRFTYPYRDVDTVTFRLPVGYIVEALPKDVSLAASFGSFQAKIIRQADSVLTYVRVLEVTSSVVPAGQYREYRKFFADIVKSDRSQAVLIWK